MGGYEAVYISSFHMPLFFIVTGYLWNNNDKQVIKDLVKNKAKRLLVPYFIFGSILTIGYSLYQVMNGNIENILKALDHFLLQPTLIIPGGSTLWFLPCMFLVVIVYSFLKKYFKRTYGVICFVLAIVAVMYSYVDINIELPWCIQPTLMALIFVFVGEQLKKNAKTTDYILTVDKIPLLIIVIASIVLVFLNGKVDMRSSEYGNAILYIINSILGTLIWWNIATKILKYTNRTIIKKFVSALTYLSVNAMPFIVSNRFVISGTQKILEYVLPDIFIVLWFARVLSIVVCILCGIVLNKIVHKLKIQVILGQA